jgi:hypothetical protein
VPTHVKDLLVEVDLIGVRFLPHPLTLSSPWAFCSRASLLTIGRAGWRVYGSGNADLFGFEGGFVRLQDHLNLLVRIGWVDHEVVVVTSRHDVLGVTREHHFELVKDTVILVRVAESRPKMFVYGYCLDGLPLHVDIPNLDCQIVTGQDVAPIIRESDIRDGRYDFRKERTRGRVLLLFKHLGYTVSKCLPNWAQWVRCTLSMLVAECALSHVGQLNCSLRAGIHEPITAERVEFSGCYDLGQLLHVGGLDVDNIEALVLYVEVPEIYAEVVAADERLTITVHRDAVDVVGVGIRISAAGDSSNDSVVVCQTGELEIRRGLDMLESRGP